MLAGFAGLLVAVVLLSLAVGSRAIAPAEVLGALFSPLEGNTDQMVVRDLRIPRTVIGLIAGAALGLAGATMQGVTRNPLADPGLLGVNAGSSLFVVAGITFFGVTTPMGFVWFAFAGAAVATIVVYAIASAGRGGATPVTLALAGAALTAALTSLITLVLITDLDTLNTYRFWAVGSLVGRGLDAAGVVVPFVAIGAVLAFASARGFNVLSLGDDLARGLGQSVRRARVTSAIAVVLLCGGATALAGPIVFVGLVVPHLARRFTGADYRWILAYSLVLGPTLLLLADIVGRLIALPGELEAGIVVAFLGAPVLIAFVRRSTVKAL
ncbi:MAG: Iron transporter permease [Microbacteriaceae bacterium]|nr:Iron transporter permease [Microbacteriaceae bacterium]